MYSVCECVSTTLSKSFFIMGFVLWTCSKLWSHPFISITNPLSLYLPFSLPHFHSLCCIPQSQIHFYSFRNDFWWSPFTLPLSALGYCSTAPRAPEPPLQSDKKWIYSSVIGDQALFVFATLFFLHSITIHQEKSSSVSSAKCCIGSMHSLMSQL